MNMQTATAPPSPSGELDELEDRFAARPLSDVLDDVASYNRRFIYHQDESTHWLIALWVAHAHGLDTWDYTGRLYITAPDYGVGKSEQAKVMANLCPNAYRSASVSAPGLFGAIDEMGRPTLFIDEADNQFSPYGGKDKADVTSVINGGYEFDAPGVFRRVGGATREYRTYTAMAIVGKDNGTLPKATRTRCIPVQMVPKPPGSSVEKYRSRIHGDFHDEIRWQLSSAAMDYKLTPCPFNNRQADLWESLWSVAAAAGGEWPERCRVASERHQWKHDVSEGRLFLLAVRDWFEAHPQETKVQSSVLAAHVSSYDDLPRMEGKGVALRMQGYEVSPQKRSSSWYHREKLEPVWERWLPPVD